MWRPNADILIPDQKQFEDTRLRNTLKCRQNTAHFSWFLTLFYVNKPKHYF